MQELARDSQPQVPTTVESLVREAQTCSTQAKLEEKSEVSRSGETSSSTMSSSTLERSKQFSLTQSSQTTQVKLEKEEQNVVSRSEEVSSSTISSSMAKPLHIFV